MNAMPPDAIQSLRYRLYEVGYRPLPVYSHDHSVEHAGKRPLGNAWQEEARRDPPFCTVNPSVPHASNTGILCDGLRAIDVDIDNLDIAGRVKALVIERFGEAPLRYRPNSGRVLIVYRAADGEPVKRSITGTAGKIEVLGRGQQFVGFGTHPSGAALQWQGSLLDTPRAVLPAVSETALTDFLSAAAPMIGADAPKAEPDHRADHEPSQFGPSADPLDIAAALAAIPNNGPADWEWFNKIGMATWHASGGSSAGYAAWLAWSERHPLHDPELCRSRWSHYISAPPGQIGAGTLVFLAREARPGWRKPSDSAPPPHNAAEPWSAPDLSLIREQAIAAPPIPDSILPPAWARWTAEAAEGAGAPHAFVAVALLSAAGTVIGNARWAAPWHPWSEPPAINAALIGRPSSGKSPALDQITALLATLEMEANEDLKDRRREAKRDAMQAAEKLKVYETEVKTATKMGNAAPLPPEGCEPVKTPQRRRIYSTSPTIEAAGKMSDANPRGLLLQRDELAGWIASMDRYSGGGSGDRQFWLQAYGGRAWTPDRVKDGDEPVHIPHLLWNILGTIQPDRVSTLMMSGDDDGLSVRFLYCWPEALPPRRPSCRADTEAALGRLRRLRALPWTETPEPKVLPFTGTAAAALHEWRIEVASMEAEAGGLMLSWLGKLPGLAVRIALVLELLEWSETPIGTPDPEAIGERTTIAAITFLHGFAIPMARRTFGAAALPEAERDGRRLARWLIQQRPMPQSVNARDLRRRSDGPPIPDSERMEAALRELEGAYWTRPATSAAPGRPRKDWAVNPKLEGYGA